MAIPILLTHQEVSLTVASYRDEVEFYGHPMVRSMHPTTIEVTKDAHLTPRGDCIIGVRADKGLSELSSDVREAIVRKESRLLITVEVLQYTFLLKATGGPELTLESPSEMVIRKSTWISPRTLALNADAAARDIPRAIVESLRNPATKGVLKIEVHI
jgi:hypothetical protein